MPQLARWCRVELLLPLPPPAATMACCKPWTPNLHCSMRLNRSEIGYEKESYEQPPVRSWALISLATPLRAAAACLN